MPNAFDILKERGFIEQCTHEDALRKRLDSERVTFYIGYDPTADSLTIGHYLTLTAMAHMQRAGHRPVVLVGGGTGMVGDPTDRTELRKMMTREEVMHNADCFKQQIARFIDFSDGENGAIMVDNSEWLMALSYVPFLREYGVHFSVNRMLTADAYRTRMERGLTFFEFNYMLMQSYDFLTLYRRYGCCLQMGGNDQWSNIIAGADLIRRVEGGEAYGLTLTLLTTGEGKKMGKSQAGAVWLDPARTSPYDFFQHWRNTDDSQVLRNLQLLTFLPMDEINAMREWEGSSLNRAKEILAYEVTKTVHGQDEAAKALLAARSLFAPGVADAGKDAIPTSYLCAADMTDDDGINIIVLLEKTRLIKSRSDGRQLVAQGGITAGGQKITSFAHIVRASDFTDGALLLQKGKKVYHRVLLAECGEGI